MNLSSAHISRENAAKKLKISIRTLDRYIRRGFFDVQRLNRSVFISAPSFEKYYQDQIEKGLLETTATSTAKDAAESTKNSTTNHEAQGAIETIEVSEADPSEVGASMSGGVGSATRGPGIGERGGSGQSIRDHATLGKRHEQDYGPHAPGGIQPVGIYKSLYEAMQEKYEEQQKRLEGAHYRVGQLEAQVKNMVPLLEIKKERKRLEIMDRRYQDSIKIAKVRVIRTKQKFKREQLNKNVYIALVYGLLSLQPVFWILFQG